MGPRDGPNIGTQDRLGSDHQTRANDRNWYYQRSIDLPRRFEIKGRIDMTKRDLSVNPQKPHQRTVDG